MTAPRYYGGAPDDVQFSDPVAVRWRREIFWHYVATVWIHAHDVPRDPPALDTFALAPVWMDYRRFVAASGEAPKRGLTLDELWTSSQLVMRVPLELIVNADLVDEPLPHVTRVARLPRADFIARLEAIYAELPSHDAAHPFPVLPIQLCVYDGAKVSHVITLFSIHEGLAHYHDTWPTGSLLVESKNAAGVRARPSTLLSNGWMITLAELRRVGTAAVRVLARPRPLVELTPEEDAARRGFEQMMSVVRGMQRRPPGAPGAPATGMTQVPRIVGDAATGDTWRIKVAINGGDDVNAPSELGTALQVAAKAGHLAVVGLLVDHGADLGATDPDGKTAAQLAAEAGHAEVAARLDAIAAAVRA